MLRSPPLPVLNASALGELITSHSKIYCLRRRLSLRQGLRCPSRSKVHDFVERFPVTLLVETIGPDAHTLVSCLRVVDGDRAVLDQPLDEKVTQGDVFCPGVLGAIAGNMKRLRVVDEERNTVEPILES